MKHCCVRLCYTQLVCGQYNNIEETRINDIYSNDSIIGVILVLKIYIKNISRISTLKLVYALPSRTVRTIWGAGNITVF